MNGSGSTPFQPVNDVGVYAATGNRELNFKLACVEVFAFAPRVTGCRGVQGVAGFCGQLCVFVALDFAYDLVEVGHLLSPLLIPSI